MVSGSVEITSPPPASFQQKQLDQKPSWDSPTAWTKSDRTSPVTKIAVNHFALINDRWSPSQRRINRPKSMYMEAAMKAGEIKMPSVSRMYAVLDQSGVFSALYVRAVYPMVSTVLQLVLALRSSSMLQNRKYRYKKKGGLRAHDSRRR